MSGVVNSRIDSDDVWGVDLFERDTFFFVVSEGGGLLGVGLVGRVLDEIFEGCLY